MSPAAAHPIEPAQRRRAERLLLAALRRLHRARPLESDHRVDAVIHEVHVFGTGRRPAGHRGAGRLELDDAALLVVVDGLVADGRLRRSGRRVALAEHAPRLAAQDRERVDQLLDALRAAGGSPPRVETLAARLGITPALIAQLRASGRLVALAPGIDYPRDVFERLSRRLDELATDEPPTVARVATALGISRRYASALLRSWSGSAEETQTAPRRRPVGISSPARPRTPPDTDSPRPRPGRR